MHPAAGPFAVVRELRTFDSPFGLNTCPVGMCASPLPSIWQYARPYQACCDARTLESLAYQSLHHITLRYVEHMLGPARDE